MAVFKVGQRVRIRQDALLGSNPSIVERNARGQEAIILTYLGDSHPQSPTKVGPWYKVVFQRGTVDVFHTALEPLTDPKADAFIESLKRLRYEEPRAPGKVHDIVNDVELDKYRGGSQ